MPKNKKFEFRFDPVGDIMLPSLQDWDLYQRVITFRFYRIQGERLRRDGVYAHPDKMEDTSKVISSFFKRVDGNYPVSRMKLFWDYFIHIMNSGPGSLNMGRFFQLEGVLKLKLEAGYKREEVDVNGCVVACWRRYINALRKENVKLMALFLKRIIMPQVDIVFYNLSILNKKQIVVYRTDVEDTESLEVNPDEELELEPEQEPEQEQEQEQEQEREQDPELAGPDGTSEYRNVKISEATAVKIDKGKGKTVVVSTKDKKESIELEGIGFAKTTDEPWPGYLGIPKIVRSGTPLHAPKNGESSKNANGVARANKSSKSSKHIESVPNKLQKIRDKPLPEIGSLAGHTHAGPREEPLPEMGTVTQIASHPPVAPQSSRFTIRSTIHGCKKSVADMKRKISRITSRKLKVNTSKQHTTTLQE
ncbi:hypothetical protein TWF506_005739 [Arthrobotrys conoides]|uniref:Uncharacterized protein n=1 Tax=Arthrobotrys conoides TaxID=74498 RepID=A0AAN8NJT4_9PEZI